MDFNAFILAGNTFYCFFPSFLRIFTSNFYIKKTCKIKLIKYITCIFCELAFIFSYVYKFSHYTKDFRYIVLLNKILLIKQKSVLSLISYSSNLICKSCNYDSSPPRLILVNRNLGGIELKFCLSEAKLEVFQIKHGRFLFLDPI